MTHSVDSSHLKEAAATLESEIQAAGVHIHQTVEGDVMAAAPHSISWECDTASISVCSGMVILNVFFKHSWGTGTHTEHIITPQQ